MANRTNSKIVNGRNDDDELTIEKIKGACLKHFAPQTRRDVVCDVLAGEQGPSCSKLVDDEDNEILFTAGNLSKEAISTFIKEHVCNYCDKLGLDSY